MNFIVNKSLKCPLTTSQYHLQCRTPMIWEWWVLTTRRKDNCPANERDKLGAKTPWALGSDLDSPGCLPWNYAEGRWDSAQNLSLWWTLLWCNFQLGYLTWTMYVSIDGPLGTWNWWDTKHPSSSSVQHKSCTLVSPVVSPHHNTGLTFQCRLQNIHNTFLSFVLHSTIDSWHQMFCV